MTDLATKKKTEDKPKAKAKPEPKKPLSQVQIQIRNAQQLKTARETPGITIITQPEVHNALEKAVVVSPKGEYVGFVPEFADAALELAGKYESITKKLPKHFKEMRDAIQTFKNKAEAEAERQELLKAQAKAE